ncbi:MAG: hypothetical protein ACREO4_06440 [Lysobacter sp.]
MSQLCTLERFHKDIATHELTIVKDDGVHRHLQFRRPGTYCYGFDIVTWPGYLAISGDMGAAVFSRLNDMCEFFREKSTAHEPPALYINPGYWAEKCVANNGPHKEFDETSFRKFVSRAFSEFVDQAEVSGSEAAAELWEQLDREVVPQESTHDAIVALADFESDNDLKLEFPDAWEWASSFEVYTFHFIWRLYAIAHAVRAYDAAKAAAAPFTGVQPEAE